MGPILYRRRHLLAVLLFIILIVPSLNNLPYGDDNVFVFESYLQNVPSIFNFWDPYSNFFKSWPLSFSVFTLLLKNFGKEVIVFRLLNVALHVLNAFLFQKSLKWWRPGGSRNEKYLLFCLFLIHPISLMTVNWVFQLKTLLCMTFTLLSLICFEKAAKSRPFLYSSLTVVFFFFALNSKIACVLFPFYVLARWNSFSKKVVLVPLSVALFCLSGFYGLINLKGINSFVQEKTTSTKQVTDYGESFDKMAVKPSFTPSNYYQTDLTYQLSDSARQLTKQFDSGKDLKLKAMISLFTFGRYINSSLGLNRYSLIYEPTWASLSSGVVVSFIGVSFVFFLIFVSKRNWKELLLCLLFFIPVSGMLYVPYMKFSYVADHWFYLSLPFLLSIVLIGKPKKFQTLIGLIICAQFLVTSYDFKSTISITEKSLREYQNPFLYTYIMTDLERRQNFQEAYDMVSNYIIAKGYIDELAIKTRLRINLEHLKNRLLGRDLEQFIRLLIGQGDFKTALGFLNEYKGVFSKKKVVQYQVLLLGLSGVKNPNGASLLLEQSKPLPRN